MRAKLTQEQIEDVVLRARKAFNRHCLPSTLFYVQKLTDQDVPLDWQRELKFYYEEAQCACECCVQRLIQQDEMLASIGSEDGEKLVFELKRADKELSDELASLKYALQNEELYDKENEHIDREGEELRSANEQLRAQHEQDVARLSELENAYEKEVLLAQRLQQRANEVGDEQEVLHSADAEEGHFVRQSDEVSSDTAQRRVSDSLDPEEGRSEGGSKRFEEKECQTKLNIAEMTDLQMKYDEMRNIYILEEQEHEEQSAWQKEEIEALKSSIEELQQELYAAEEITAQDDTPQTEYFVPVLAQVSRQLVPIEKLKLTRARMPLQTTPTQKVMMSDASTQDCIEAIESRCLVRSGIANEIEQLAVVVLQTKQELQVFKDAALEQFNAGIAELAVGIGRWLASQQREATSNVAVTPAKMRYLHSVGVEVGEQDNDACAFQQEISYLEQRVARSGSICRAELAQCRLKQRELEIWRRRAKKSWADASCSENALISAEEEFQALVLKTEQADNATERALQLLFNGLARAVAGCAEETQQLFEEAVNVTSKLQQVSSICVEDFKVFIEEFDEQRSIQTREVYEPYVQRLTAQLVRFQRDNDSYSAVYSQLREHRLNLNTLKVFVKSFICDNEEFNEAVNRLTVGCNQLYSKYEELDLEKIAVEERCSEIKRVLESQESIVDKLAEENAELKETLKAANEEIEEQTQQFEQRFQEAQQKEQQQESELACMKQELTKTVEDSKAAKQAQEQKSSAEIADLQQQLKQHEEESTKLAKKCAELEAGVEEVALERSHAKNVEQRCLCAENAVAQLQQRLEHIEAQNTRLAAAGDIVDEHLAALDGRLIALGDDFASLIDLINAQFDRKLQYKMQKLDNREAPLLDHIQALCEFSQQIMFAIAQFRTYFTDLTADFNKALAEGADLRDKVAAQEAEIASLHSNKVSLDEKCETLKTRVCEQTSEIENYAAALEKQSASQLKFEALIEQTEAQENEALQREERIVQLSEEIERLQACCDEEHEMRLEGEQREQEAQKAILQLQESLRSAQDRLAAEKSSASSLEGQIATQQQHIFELISKISVGQESAAIAEQQRQRLEQEISRLKALIGDLTRELEAMQQRGS